MPEQVDLSEFLPSLDRWAEDQHPAWPEDSRLIRRVLTPERAVEALRPELEELLRLRMENVHSFSIDISEIDRQRDLGWPDFGPEDYCHKCGGVNVPSWSVDSDRFNMAFSREHAYGGIVCPGCFVVAHERATGMYTTWKLVPDAMVPFQHGPRP